MKEQSNIPKIVTATNHSGTIVTNFMVRHHEFSCDEMPLYGGRDESPDPYDYLLSAVAGCTAITLRQFADENEWDIGDINIRISYDRDQDGNDLFDKNISFTGTLSGDQKSKLLEAAYCNTEKLLKKGISFSNSIVDQ